MRFFCPICGDRMVIHNGELICLNGNMYLSENMKHQFKKRYNLLDENKSSLSNNKFYCPGCGVPLDKNLTCNLCLKSLADLYYQLIEYHPHERVKNYKYYYFNEGKCKLPSDWLDETTIALVWPLSDSSSSTFSLTIEKESIVNHQDLESYVNEQIHALENELNKFKEIARNEITIDNQPANEIKFSWYSEENEKIVQRQAFVLYNMMVLIFNGTTIDNFNTESDKKWEFIINNFTFRKNNQ